MDFAAGGAAAFGVTGDCAGGRGGTDTGTTGAVCFACAARKLLIA